ncbi:MAG: 3-oxoacyl-ACP reductase [Deltaproteobacteria bacterium]|nr:3-oxoacyl-ACP reductase [Deltaproteobacteria bacterium]
MGKRLQDKVAIVTGAGSIGPGWGNGKASAVLFAREGAKVFAVDLNRAAAEETKGLIDQEGGLCTVHQADVTKSAEVKAFVERCLEIYGRVDVLLNNVGIVESGGPVEISEENWDRLIDINLKSMFLTCKYCLPVMEKQGSGAIVNISSIGALRFLGYPCVSYNASKGAVNQLTQNIAVQYAAKGIRANCVLPGLMNTPMIREPLKKFYAGGDIDKMIEIRNQQCPMKKMGDAWDVAYAAIFLASDEAKYITGANLVVDGGITCKFS